jgi:hypothetical protein
MWNGDSACSFRILYWKENISMSWGLATCLLSAVPWAVFVLASIASVGCASAAAAVLDFLCLGAAIVTPLTAMAAFINDDGPALAIVGLMLAGAFVMRVGRGIRREPLWPCAIAITAATVGLAVTFWGPTATDQATLEVGSNRVSWLLPSLTLFLSWSVVFLHAWVVPYPLRLFHMWGMREPNYYALLFAIPRWAIVIAAASLSAAAIWQHGSWTRSVLLATAAVAVNASVILCLLGCLGRLRWAYSRIELSRQRPEPEYFL